MGKRNIHKIRVPKFLEPKLEKIFGHKLTCACKTCKWARREAKKRGIRLNG